MNATMKNNTKCVHQCFFDFDKGEMKEEVISVEKSENAYEETSSLSYFKSNLDEISRSNLFRNDGSEKKYTSFLSQATIILRKNLNGVGYELAEEEQGKKTYVQRFKTYDEALENFAYWVETIDLDHL